MTTRWSDLSSESVPTRLRTIHAGIEAFLHNAQHRWGGPSDAFAIEQIFRHKSSESALRLGQARGVALLAAAQAALPVHEYSAMTIKKTVAGHGRAAKPQVGLMVQRLLGLEAPLPSDAADARIAVTHLTLGAQRARPAALAASPMIAPRERSWPRERTTSSSMYEGSATRSMSPP